MEKKNIIIIVLSSLLVITGGFICYDKLLKKSDDSKPNTEIQQKETVVETNEEQIIEPSNEEEQNIIDDNTINEGSSKTNTITPKPAKNGKTTPTPKPKTTATPKITATPIPGDTHKYVDPIVEKWCDLAGAVIEGDKCVNYTTYEAKYQKYSCPSGYTPTDDGKCGKQVTKQPHSDPYCENKLARMENGYCIEGASSSPLDGFSYGTPQVGSDYKVYKTQAYKEAAQINCPDNSTKETNDTGAWCKGEDSAIVKPLKATCSHSGGTVSESNNVYSCSGTIYYYHYCSNGSILMNDKCYPGTRVLYANYCDNDVEITNGKCIYIEKVNPSDNTPKYVCNSGDKLDPNRKGWCLHAEDRYIKLHVAYKCENGTILTSDNRCRY